MASEDDVSRFLDAVASYQYSMSVSAQAAHRWAGLDRQPPTLLERARRAYMDDRIGVEGLEMIVGYLLSLGIEDRLDDHYEFSGFGGIAGLLERAAER